MTFSNTISQKEYLKKYLSGDDHKKKKKKKISSSSLKRSTIIDDDIDLKNMRPLEDDEVELYQMDEDAPQVAGIIDERPTEVKAKEYYNSKRWKVFGGEDGLSVVDNMDNNLVTSKQTESSTKDHKDLDLHMKDENPSYRIDKTLKVSSEDKFKILSKKDFPTKNRPTRNSPIRKDKEITRHASDLDFKSPPRKDKKQNSRHENDSDNSPPRRDSRKNIRNASDSDYSPPRRDTKNISRHANDSDNSPLRKNNKKNRRHASDSDNSPPRRNNKNISRHANDSDNSPLRSDKKKNINNASDSDNSPPRRDNKKNRRQANDSDNSPPRRENKKNRRYASDSDNSPPRKNNKNITRHANDSDNSPPRRDNKKNRRHASDSDNSPPRRNNKNITRHANESDLSPPRRDKNSNREKAYSYSNSTKREKEEAYNRGIIEKKFSLTKKSKKYSSSDSDSLPSKRAKSSMYKRERSSRSKSPSFKPLLSNNPKLTNKNTSPRLSRKDMFNKKITKRRFSDSDDSPPRRRSGNSFCLDENDSDTASERKQFSFKKEYPTKKPLYKPNDSSSEDDGNRFKSKKMKTTLDGKQAGLQDAKQLKKELSDLKSKEDLMFSKMDASVSGVGAAPIKRDRKTGQVRDLEKEKEIQKEKEAKASVVNEKYYKWGKGIKQVEDAADRAQEVMKEMNKPLARYVDDKDLDEFLKAQEREGDPMLDYIKKKQSEATPLAGVKPIYKGSYNPNRFGIRPGHRWDGVVRSNGYEKEWFTTQNARKARDDEAYKWSTSDM